MEEMVDKVKTGRVSIKKMNFSSNINNNILAQYSSSKLTIQNGMVIPVVKAEELAMLTIQSAWHATAIDIKTKAVAGRGYTGGEKIETLNAAPTKEIRNVVTDYYAFGRAYVEVVKGIDNKPAAFYHTPSLNIYAAESGKGFYQKISESKKKYFKDFLQWDDIKPGESCILAINSYHPAFPEKMFRYGFPMWLPLSDTIKLDKSARTYNIRYFDNGAMTDFLLIVEGGELDEKAEEQIKEYIEDNAMGLNNSHKILMVSVEDEKAKVRIENLGSLKEAAFRLLRQDNRDEIYSMHRIPPRLAGVIQSGQLGGGGEIWGQLMIFQETEVKPEQEMIQENLNRIFGLLGDSSRISLNSLYIITEGTLQMLISAGAIEKNELRDMFGLETTESSKEDTEKSLLFNLQEIRKRYERSE